MASSLSPAGTGVEKGRGGHRGEGQSGSTVHCGDGNDLVSGDSGLGQGDDGRDGEKWPDANYSLKARLEMGRERPGDSRLWACRTGPSCRDGQARGAQTGGRWTRRENSPEGRVDARPPGRCVSSTQASERGSRPGARRVRTDARGSPGRGRRRRGPREGWRRGRRAR